MKLAETTLRLYLASRGVAAWSGSHAGTVDELPVATSSPGVGAPPDYTATSG